MTRKLTIVVSDRNPNVRELLKREMIEAGHRVMIAKNAEELRDLVCKHKTVDIVIFDPDLAYVSEADIHEKIIEWTSQLLVIIHSFQNDNNWKDFPDNTRYVEKGENSIERIKIEINKVMERSPFSSDALHY